MRSKRTNRLKKKLLKKNMINSIFIISFWLLANCASGFHVNFRENYDAKLQSYSDTKIFKREMSQFFNKASYSFNGLKKIDSIPVLFPLDICILRLDGSKYATSLHYGDEGFRHISFFKMNNGNYSLIADMPAPIAIAMDCAAIEDKGYIAVTFNITTPIESANQGSPVFEISGDHVRPLQFFASLNMVSMSLHVTGTDLFLLQSFRNTKDIPNLHCPYFIWTDLSFHKLGQMPCSNARHLEPFEIDNENYIAMANYADQRGRTSVFSEIYKLAPEKKKFQLFQKIRTNGAVDVKYFNVPLNEGRKSDFLVFGNSISTNGNSKNGTRSLEADSVFYIFDKGQFVPYQSLSLYAVEKFLPVQNTDAEKFLLLVACSNQDIKIYNLNDWKFEESDAQLTEGALGKGIENMRVFQENDDSYLVIANKLMVENEVNIFLPIFKQDEHANQLRQQIIDWAKANIERLEGLDVVTLQKNIEMRLLARQQEISNYKIKKVYTKSLIYPTLHFSENYWKALKYANLALDALESQIQSRKKRELHEKSTNKVFEYDQARVNTLIVLDKLEAQQINGVNAETLQFDSISARQINVTGRYTGPVASKNESQHMKTEFKNLEFDNLEISRLLNNYTWSDLMNNTMKLAGNQILTSPVTFGNLQAENVFVADNKLNERNLTQLISINDERDIFVEQDVQFSSNVTVNNLQIRERLNNIRVVDNKLDVLLKNSNQTQVITKTKTIDNVRILEPITIAGQMFGKHLKSITPNKAIHEPLVLKGDYIINGSVLILKTLSAMDMIDLKSKTSVNDVLSKGIDMNEPLNDVNLNFEQPLAVNESFVSFINGQSMQKLIKTNVNEVQIVEAEKIFKNSLRIHKGFGEVKILNGFDIETLEKTIFLRNTQQHIKHPMHFGEITSKNVHAPELLLNNKNLSDFLTKSGAQNIRGSLRVEKVSTQTLTLQNLNTNDKIFGARLSEIYEQKSISAPSSSEFQLATKFQGSLYVKNLILNSTINDRKVQDMERQLSQLDGNIKYVGNFIFNYDMDIKNLTFFDKFNGIPADNFGRCWLQKSGDQTFTEQQTFARAECKNGTHLDGKLNAYSIDDIFNKTYWTNRNEHIKDTTIFQSPIQMEGALLTERINGIRIPEEIFYRRSAKQKQNLNEKLYARDIFVNGSIYKTKTVNGFDLMKFDQYLKGLASQTLYVDNVQFALKPFYKTLNHNDMKRLINMVWLANENIDLRSHVEIAEADFTGLLEFEGPINNMNMRFLKENYFSRTLPQEIGSEIILRHNNKFENRFSTEDLRLFGPIIECRSGSQIHFDEFVRNSLKKDSSHSITAPWSILRATIHGDMQNVLINNLNLVNDVVRMDAPLNIITAPKFIQSAVIKKLYATMKTKVNDVCVAHWVQEAIYVYENYTIRGTTTLDSVNIYNDLRVLEKVNNITFDADTLLLRDSDQIMHNDVFIHNELSADQRIFTTNFQNLQADFVNGINITSLTKQVITTERNGDNKQNTQPLPHE